MYMLQHIQNGFPAQCAFPPDAQEHLATCYPVEITEALTRIQTLRLPTPRMANAALHQYFFDAFTTRRLRHVDVMAHVIGQRELPPNCPLPIHQLLEDAVIVSLDAEWFERGLKALTELGLGIMATLATNPDSPMHELCRMLVYHARIMENAHMVNGKRCHGHPENFEFGPTTFVTMQEAQQMLVNSFQWWRPDGSLRPVVFLGHAVDNDIEAMKEHLSVDLHALGIIAVTLDTQVMAQEVGIANRQISLKDILAQFAIDEPYLHNAGNDVAQTMIAAWLLAQESINPESYWGNPHNQDNVNHLKRTISLQANPLWGIPIFCTRCDSASHMVGQCTTPVWCVKCAGNPRWAKSAYTHKTEKCGVLERSPDLPAVSPSVVSVVVPCQHCVESNEPRRWKNANTHTTELCFFGQQLGFN